MARLTRREFIKTSALAAASTTLAPRFATAQPKEVLLAAVRGADRPQRGLGSAHVERLPARLRHGQRAGRHQVHGRCKLKYTVADTESKPEVAGSQTEKVIQRGCVAITGTNQSAATIVATQIAEREGVPFVCATDVDPLITSRGFNTPSARRPSVESYARDLLTYVKELGTASGKPAKKLAILSENSIVAQSPWKAPAAWPRTSASTWWRRHLRRRPRPRTSPATSPSTAAPRGSADRPQQASDASSSPADEELTTTHGVRRHPGGHVSTEYLNALARTPITSSATTSWSGDSTSPASRTSQEVPGPLRKPWTHQRRRFSASRCCGIRWSAPAPPTARSARCHRGHVTQDGREDVPAAARREVSDRRARTPSRAGWCSRSRARSG